jgi:hypothetical protein
MGSFAEHLIERNAVSPEQLGRALQAKRLYGGRLGSNLVETGALEAAELSARLSEYLGVPPPPGSWLAERSAKAEKTVPSELIHRHKIVPLRVEKRTLHVAALDPHDAALREALDQATDLKVEIWVLPELRIYSLLGKRYGIRRERSVSLSQLAEQARRRREARAPAAAPEPDPEEKERRALGIAPLEEGEELVGETFFSDLHARHLPGNADSSPAEGLPPLDDSLFEPIEPAPPELPEAPAEAMDPHELTAPAEVAAPSVAPTCAHPFVLEQAIASAPDRQTLIDSVLELACAHAESSAFLVLDDGMLAGQRARVEGETRTLAGVRVRCRPESALAGAMASGEPFRGTPGASVDEGLLAELGRLEAAELAFLPIQLGDLAVAVLCVDGGAHPLGETAFAALGALARIASERWEQLTLGPGR